MDNLCKGDIVISPVTANQIYDYSRSSSKVSSNISIKFDILSDILLPRNTKVEIIETEFEYTFNNIDKNIHINGHKIKKSSNCLEEIICISDKYINLVDNSYKCLVLNITESLNVEIDVNVRIKGIAHINSCDKICFEAIGKGKDKISSIIVSNIYIPNTSKCFKDNYLKVKNDIVGLANPEYIFLSPLFDCCGCIEFLMGNVFINYCINLDMLSIVPSDINLISYKY